jgi:Flp pilus assembly protein TadD
MRLFDRSNHNVAVALCVLIGMSGAAIQPAHAGWLKNPFAKKPQDGEDLTKPPPGMTDSDADDENAPTNKATTKYTTDLDKKGIGFKPIKDDDNDKDKKEATSDVPEKKEDSTDNDPDLHLRMAKRMTERMQYHDALLQINKALTLNPKMWEARYLGAYVYQMEGRFPEAIQRYQQYIKVKPDNAQAHINLGVCLRHENRIDEAEDEYRKAIDMNYYSLEAHFNLANIFIAHDELEKAIKELLACEKIAPTNAWVHNNLGVIYQKRDYMEEAEQEFNKAANLEPANKTFTLNLDLAREQLQQQRQSAAKPKPVMM